jgi:ribA/ribD-fused uncharacterized protein
MKTINSFKRENHFLSNFYNAPVKYEGIFYLNNEAAFQSAKVLSKEERLKFETLQPNVAKSLGRRVKLRSDWETIKDQVMYDCVKDKFTRHEDLSKKLLDTEDAILVEGNTWKDDYWGVCNGKGLNKLGHILMKVRDELREVGK